MDDEWIDTCGCGKPLHYDDPDIESLVRGIVSRVGPTITVRVIGARAFEVPRHYIALHGIRGQDVAALAAEYGWQEATRE